MDAFLVKIIFHYVGSFLCASQIASNISHHLAAIVRPHPASSVALDIVVQHLVGVKFRAVARKKENSDAVRILLDPILCLFCNMRRMTVDYKKNLSFDLTQESAQKFQKHVSVKILLENHEKQSPTICNRGYHVA